jgi:hypothetical protein
MMSSANAVSSWRPNWPLIDPRLLAAGTTEHSFRTPGTTALADARANSYGGSCAVTVAVPRRSSHSVRILVCDYA